MTPRRFLLVLGHARRASLGHHLLARARTALEGAGHDVRVHDLLQDGFDPVLRLADDQEHAGPCALEDDALCHRYQQDVLWADRYVLLHPVWWFAPPAILKGWVDRVLVNGIALEHGKDDPPRGTLQGKRVLIVQTFNAPRTVDQVVMRSLSYLFWKRAVCFPTAIEKTRRLALYGVEKASPAQIERFAGSLERKVLSL